MAIIVGAHENHDQICRRNAVIAIDQRLVILSVIRSGTDTGTAYTHRCQRTKSKILIQELIINLIRSDTGRNAVADKYSSFPCKSVGSLVPAVNTYVIFVIVPRRRLKAVHVFVTARRTGVGGIALLGAGGWGNCATISTIAHGNVGLRGAVAVTQGDLCCKMRGGRECSDFHRARIQAIAHCRHDLRVQCILHAACIDNSLQAPLHALQLLCQIIHGINRKGRLLEGVRAADCLANDCKQLLVDRARILAAASLRHRSVLHGQRIAQVKIALPKCQNVTVVRNDLNHDACAHQITTKLIGQVGGISFQDAITVLIKDLGASKIAAHGVLLDGGSADDKIRHIGSAICNLCLNLRNAGKRFLIYSLSAKHLQGNPVSCTVHQRAVTTATADIHKIGIPCDLRASIAILCGNLLDLLDKSGKPCSKHLGSIYQGFHVILHNDKIIFVVFEIAIRPCLVVECLQMGAIRSVCIAVSS